MIEILFSDEGIVIDSLFIFFISIFFNWGISVIIQIMYFLLLDLVLGCQSSQCISCFAFLLQITSDFDIFSLYCV
jgi:hypothetical protein